MAKLKRVVKGGRPIRFDGVKQIETAMEMLRSAIRRLRAAGAVKSADAARRALSSAKGAARHARHRPCACCGEPEYAHVGGGTCPDGSIIATPRGPVLSHKGALRLGRKA